MSGRQTSRRIRRFWAHTGGVAAVEFAFVAPILIFFYFGVVETCQLLMAQRRVAHAASTMADLITQDTDIENEEMEQLYEAACTIMKPFRTTSVKVRVTSVSRRAPAGTATTGPLQVDWSEDNGRGLNELADNTDLTNNNGAIKVDTPLNTTGDSVVVAEMTYELRSPIGYFMPGLTTLRHEAEMRPRKSPKVIRSVGDPPPAGAPAKTCSQ